MYWYDGRIFSSSTIELAIDEPALLYGATVFTTLRVYDHCLDGGLSNWAAHCDRLQSSLEYFEWTGPNWDVVRRGAQLLAREFPVLRITIFADGRELITGRLLPPDLAVKQQHGVSTFLANSQLLRALPSHKTGNYLSPWLARNQSQKVNAQEAILVNEAGNWLETTTGNLWGWQNGSWWTPPITEGILAGVMRGKIIENLPGVREEPWTKNLVRGFEAMAYTNSVVEIIPIHTVEQGKEPLKYNPYHPSFQKIREAF